MDTESTRTLGSSAATAGVLAMVGYWFADRLPGQPNAVLAAVIAGAAAFALLVNSRPATSSVRRDQRSTGRTLAIRTSGPAPAAGTKRTLSDALHAEEILNEELYGSIQSDLLAMTDHEEGSSDREFFFQRVRQNERRLVQSDSRIRKLRRRLRAA